MFTRLDERSTSAAVTWLQTSLRSAGAGLAASDAKRMRQEFAETEFTRRALHPAPGFPQLRNTQCPMPNAQCPMPNAQCPMPDAQCPTPNGRCPMPNARCPMPNAQCPLPTAQASRGGRGAAAVDRRPAVAALERATVADACPLLRGATAVHAALLEP